MEKIIEIKPQEKNTMSVPTHLRRALHARASGQCEFIDGKSKQRCQCRVNLQVDHALPRAWGGGHELGNLRLLCRSHNLERAVKAMGVEKMARWRTGQLKTQTEKLKTSE